MSGHFFAPKNGPPTCRPEYKLQVSEAHWVFSKTRTFFWPRVEVQTQASNWPLQLLIGHWCGSAELPLRVADSTGRSPDLILHQTLILAQGFRRGVGEGRAHTGAPSLVLSFFVLAFAATVGESPYQPSPGTDCKPTMPSCMAFWSSVD